MLLQSLDSIAQRWSAEDGQRLAKGKPARAA
jgi:hypothetical protein